MWEKLYTYILCYIVFCKNLLQFFFTNCKRSACFLTDRITIRNNIFRYKVGLVYKKKYECEIKRQSMEYKNQGSSQSNEPKISFFLEDNQGHLPGCDGVHIKFATRL